MDIGNHRHAVSDASEFIIMNNFHNGGKHSFYSAVLFFVGIVSSCSLHVVYFAEFVDE